MITTTTTSIPLSADRLSLLKELLGCLWDDNTVRIDIGYSSEISVSEALFVTQSVHNMCSKFDAFAENYRHKTVGKDETVWFYKTVVIETRGGHDPLFDNLVDELIVLLYMKGVEVEAMLDQRVYAEALGVTSDQYDLEFPEKDDYKDFLIYMPPSFF